MSIAWRLRKCTGDCFFFVFALALWFPNRVESGLFDAFPRVDDSQLAVYDGDILQVIGTAAASSLISVLRDARDAEFQPLLVTSKDPEKYPRALLSVGIADFRNTSAGSYRELVIAFPACAREAALVLECSSFSTCQSQLPDCAQTYMFRSFVSKQAALWVVRSFGVDAQLAAVFEFVREPGDIIRFSVLGPGNSEIFQGSVKSGSRSQRSSENSERTRNHTQHLSRDGYDVHPYVGIPGVLGPGQARYLCAFSKSISVEPVGTAGPLNAGKLLAEFDFKPEGIFHLANASVMQFPPLGYQTARSVPNAASTELTRPAGSRQDNGVGPGLTQGSSGGHAPRGDDDVDASVEVEDCHAGIRDCGQIPWKRRDFKLASKKDSEKQKDFPWNAYKDAPQGTIAATEPTAIHRPRSSSQIARSSGQRSPKSGDVGLATLLSEL